VLAGLKGLRGTVLDPFARTAERRMEKRLLADYEADLETIGAALAPGRIEAAAALASVPDLIRGYGHVKLASVAKAEPEAERLRRRLGAEEMPRTLEAAE